MAGGSETIPSNRFFLEIPGMDKIGSISEVSGLDNESDVAELTQVSPKGKLVVRKNLGAMPLKMGKLTLKYAYFPGDPMQEWRQKIVTGKIEENRKNVTLKLFKRDNTDETGMSFNFLRCWPSKYSYSSFTSKSNDVVMVTVTIEHEGFEVKGYNG